MACLNATAGLSNAMAANPVVLLTLTTASVRAGQATIAGAVYLHNVNK